MGVKWTEALFFYKKLWNVLLTLLKGTLLEMEKISKHKYAYVTPSYICEIEPQTDRHK